MERPQLLRWPPQRPRLRPRANAAPTNVDEEYGLREVKATLTAGPTTASPTAKGIPHQRPLQHPPARLLILGQGDAAVADEPALCAAEDAAAEAAGRAFEMEWDLVSKRTGSRTPLSREYS